MKITKIDLLNYPSLSDEEKLDLKRKVENLISKNHTSIEVCDIMCISPNCYHEIIRFKHPNRAKIGAKQEAYNTEEEMLNGYVKPTYEELSESEKLIYNEIYN